MKKSIFVNSLSCLMLISGSITGFSQGVLFENEILRIESVKTDYNGIGINYLTVVMENKIDTTLNIGLDITADPKFGLIRWQKQNYYRLLPDEKKQIEAEYSFMKMTSEALLRVRFGIPEATVKGPELRKYFFTDTLRMEVSPEKCFDLSNFVKKTTGHFRINGWKGSLAGKEIDRIAREREYGYSMISELLGVAPPFSIILILYPDGETKREATGHTGAGLARGNYIIEVYNENTKVNPFHETAHIILGEIGNPPAMFNEGFAVYISEVLGADGKTFSGSPEENSDKVTMANLAKKSLIPLEKLFTFEEIGSVESKYDISYPESASFVRYIIGKYGQDKFRAIVSSLRNGKDPINVESNRKRFEEVYGLSLPEIEKSWLAELEKQTF